MDGRRIRWHPINPDRTGPSPWSDRTATPTTTVSRPASPPDISLFQPNSHPESEEPWTTPTDFSSPDGLGNSPLSAEVYVDWDMFGRKRESPGRCLTESWDLHVIPIALEQFSAGVGGTRVFGYLECLPTLLNAASPTDPIFSVCTAVAGASFMNRHSYLTRRPQHTKAYVQTIHSVNRALRDPLKCRSHSVLLSVYLLGVYELILGGGNTVDYPGPVAWGIHLSGLSELLRIRGLQQFQTKTGLQLFWLVYYCIQVKCLMIGEACPYESLEWFRAIKANMSSDDTLMFQVTLYGWKAAEFGANIRRTISSGDRQAVSTLLFLLADELDDIDANISVDSIQMRRQTPSPGPPPESRRIDFDALIRENHYCAFRMQLHHSMLLLLEFTAQTPDIPKYEAFVSRCRQHSIAVTREMAGLILMSLPYILGPGFGYPAAAGISSYSRSPSWLDGLRLIQPLRVVATSPIVDEEHRGLAWLGLNWLAGEMGIHHAARPIVSEVDLAANMQTRGFFGSEIQPFHPRGEDQVEAVER